MVILTIGALLEGIGLDFIFPGTATWMLFAGVVGILVFITAVSAKNGSFEFTAVQGGQEDLEPNRASDFAVSSKPVNKSESTVKPTSGMIPPVSDAREELGSRFLVF